MTVFECKTDAWVGRQLRPMLAPVLYQRNVGRALPGKSFGEGFVRQFIQSEHKFKAVLMYQVFAPYL